MAFAPESPFIFNAAVKRIRDERQQIRDSWKRPRTDLDISEAPSEDRKYVAQFRIGAQSYMSIHQYNVFFVTNMKLFENPPGRCLFLCRPKCHGKTLLCSLVNYFYNVHSECIFDKIFPGIEPDKFNPRPCSFLVLSLNFGGLQPTSTEKNKCGKDFEDNFGHDLRSALILFCFRYKLDFPNSVSFDSIIFFEYVVNMVEMIESRIMIIIDEYDAPINSTLFSDSAGPFLEYLDGQNTAYSQFFSILKKVLKNSGNRALIVGTAPYALSEFTNIAFDMTWDKDYNDVCGILVDDMRPVLHQISLKHGWDEKKENEAFEKLVNSYNGYFFGGNARIFNSSQLVNCLQKLHSYGEFPDTDTSLPGIVLRLFSKVQEKYFHPINIRLLGGPVEFKLYRSIAIGDVWKKLDEGELDIIFSLMVYYGALTVIWDNGKMYAKIPNEVTRRGFVEILLENLWAQSRSDIGKQAVASFLTNHDADLLVGLLEVSTLLPAENYSDVVHSTESTFKTRFEVLILLGFPKEERKRIVNEYGFFSGDRGQADTVILQYQESQYTVILIKFKNSRMCDLQLTMLDHSWETQITHSKKLLSKPLDEIRALNLKQNTYNNFSNIGARFDHACKELRENATKLKQEHPHKKVVGFVMYRIGLHRVLYESFADL